MNFNFNPKASDVYQVTKAPTNKFDLAANMIGMVCTTLMVGAFMGLAAYAIHSCQPNKKGDK